MQRFITFLLAGSLVFESLFVPASALAQTASSTTSVDAMIAQLEAQIATLKTQIEALRAARMQVQTTAQGAFDLIRQLQQGMNGDDVRLLQILLAADAEIYPDGLVTGYYGRLTSEAVKRFQRKFGLSQVGRVGPQTLEKLKEFKKDKNLDEEDDNEDRNNDGDRKDKRFCVKVPPGHLIAPGWLRKHDGERQIVPICQILPPGIINNPNASTTPQGPDTTAPVIGGIEVKDKTSTSVKIEWRTNEFATGHVWYGTSTPLTLFDGSNITTKEHEIRLVGLSASTTYQFILVSRDIAGNTATSSQQSFTTQ